MATAHPIRTGIYSILPPLTALAILAISFFHGASLWFPGAFATGMVAFTAVVTRHHLAVFRIARLEEGSRRG